MMLWVEHYNARVEYFKVRLRHNGDPFGFGLVLEIEILAEYLTNDIQKLVPLWHDRSMLTMHTSACQMRNEIGEYRLAKSFEP